jgi:ribosomal protein S18 acetylase RimI-like enzyme
VGIRSGVRRADGRPDSRDVERAVAVMAQVAPEGAIGAEPPVDHERQAEALRSLLDAGGRSAMWVLDDDAGAVVGYAVARERIAGVVSLSMAVAPGARGRGGGRRLLDAVLAHAAATGAHKVDLEVWPDNGRAIALYAAAGFVVEGLKLDHYRRRDGTLRSALLMGRPVGTS